MQPSANSNAYNNLLSNCSSSGVSFEEEDDALEIEDDRPDLRMSTAASGPGLYSLDLELQEEGGLSGSWEHDLQEQYISEGSVLGTWDNSMKSVLCFGEDYSNYIRRKSELPSIDIISNDMIGLQVRRYTCSAAREECRRLSAVLILPQLIVTLFIRNSLIYQLKGCFLMSRVS